MSGTWDKNQIIKQKMLLSPLFFRKLQWFSVLCARYQGPNMHFLLYDNITSGDVSASIYRKPTLFTVYICIVFYLCGYAIVYPH